ncbi:FkbM family methyltransferase [Desulfallas thermosapovorans]|uniref:FkbM family methyltransferase n=1 Tax=Desulfallas thermosapovorans DSM 6562 TaxID=1121431 RepID=A0A5S4ZUC7_9FIRM|nr:FkbM family methyltransferase [Desulfallas thermosapovorans]TYO96590.1 FkbM family methyltransferase [Desulfallas thermosapovorans DSM 6562]
MFVSYAQNFEDVMLWRALKHVEKGFYIDIGAQDPVVDSVSLAFYEHGWRGVHIEPSSYYADKLRLARPDETVIQAAVGSKSGVISFYEIDETGLSTGDAQIAEKHRMAGFSVKETAVSCLPLAEFLERYRDYQIHWLKIDVEGMESEVIRGWSPSEVRPWIIVVESTLPLTQIETHGEWEPILLELGYEFVYFDGLNRFYVSGAHQELKKYFRYPPNVFDSVVLSGTSSNVFCALLNNKLEQREQEFNARMELSKKENQHLTAALAEQVRKNNELHDCVERLNHEREEIEENMKSTNKRLHELESNQVRQEAAYSELQARAEWLNNEWNSAKAKIDALNGEIHQWWMVADGVNRELQSVYASMSWRLTKPLRLVNKLLKSIPGYIKATLLYAKYLPRRLARWFLELGLAHVRRHPRRKAYIKGLLARWPRLQAQIYAIAEARNNQTTIKTSSPSTIVPTGSLDLSGCPASVRTTYLQLWVARGQVVQNREKEGCP